MTAWSAPTAVRPVDSLVRPPGSKSVTNRALVLAALADGGSMLSGPLRSRDTLLMADAVRALGATVTDAGDDWVVTGGWPRVVAGRIDAGNAGTVARFVPALACLASGDVVIDGDPRLRERPVAPLVAALRALGGTIEGDAIPLTVHGTGGLRGGEVEVEASLSSQLVSGLLLAAPYYETGLCVRVVHSVPSRPHLDMTVHMMRAWGASVSGEWYVEPGRYAARDLVIEPDLSGAAPFLAAAAATGGRVTVDGWPAATTQPGAMLPALLERMGCTWSGDTLTGPATLRGIDADLSDCGELTPVLAALAALAGSPSSLRGVAHLRVQETDRLAALAKELNERGGAVTELPDGLEIEPRPLRGGPMRSYDDHRLAMAWAVLGLVVPGVGVDDVETTAKTMPGFVARWTAMLA